MNGRVYDPLVGRMISADPTMPDALNGQAWNRYSYVGNDPLAFADPSGFSWLSEFFHGVANFLQNNAIVRAVVQVALSIVLSPLGPVGAALAAVVVGGLSGGKLGDILRAGAIAGATAFAFNVVGDITGHQPSFGTPAYAANVAGHAGVGCVAAVASGGQCGPGALSGAASAAAAPLVNVAFQHPQSNTVDFIGGTAASGLVGGLASVAGGGKFENGAVTGAFGYMFNQSALAPCLAGPNPACAVGAAVTGAQVLGGAIAAAGAAIYATKIAGPYSEPVIVGDSKGNNIPLAPGERLEGSEDGRYVQVKGANGQPTDVRGDYGGHPGQSDPAAQGPHGHVPGVTRPDGNPHLPVRE